MQDEDWVDGELMGAFYGGDERAFDELSRRWWGRVMRFFRRLGFLASDAEDLAQETLVKLYLTREGESFRVGEPLAPFLFTVARRLAIREWRSRRSDRACVPLNDAEGMTDEAAAPDALMGDLRECIRALPEVERIYLALCGRHGLGELSHNEIAAILGKWPAQLTAISQKARLNLRRCMEAKGYH